MKAIRQMRNRRGNQKDHFKIGEAFIVITEDCKKMEVFFKRGELGGVFFSFLVLFLPETPKIETK